MKASEILRAAEKTIWEGDDMPYHAPCRGDTSPYICDNIRNLRLAPYMEQLQVIKYIEQCIGERFSITHWLRDVHGINVYAYTNKQVQDYRRAFCLHLAEMFESWGD